MFFCFSVAHGLVGLCKQLINNFVFPTWVFAAGFNNNNARTSQRIVFKGKTNSKGSVGMSTNLYKSLHMSMINPHSKSLRYLYILKPYNYIQKHIPYCLLLVQNSRMPISRGASIVAGSTARTPVQKRSN